jgi:putative membrane-bound dehydrogenase-like protein
MRLLSSFFATCFFAMSVFAEPVVIFDGKSLDSWEGDAKWWSLKDGLITGGSLEQKVDRNYFIATKKSYHNFELRVLIKLTGTEGFINSGVQIRSVRVPNNTEMSGYQVDAGDGWWGKMYDESRRNKVVAEAKDLKAVNAAVKKNDWNEYRIRAEGPRIQSWINGVPALDYTEADGNIAQDGTIGIQVHSGGKALVQVKEVSIEELPPTPNAPTWDKVGRPGGKKPKPDGANAAPMKEGNVAAGVGPRTAEEQRATFKLPEGLEMELVAAEDPGAEIGKFIAVYFDPRGAMWTMTAFEYPVDGNENQAAAEALYKSKARDKILVYDRDPKSPTGFAQKPRVFADGLAIPLGILPYKDGCYVQHGPDIVFLRDTDGDGKADKREVILTGFGVQDSHLFPHQFMRAPGGWIWMAQGAFNYSKVSRPGEPPEKAIQFDQTRMAKFRPDGSEFTITSQGPCNIWGLVLNAEGEAFIQEANDFGYPVMPFHEFANYPGCSDRQWKSYAPEFPGTAPHFKMGGTGLSGLALTDKDGIYPDAWRDMMLVANPITNRVQAIKMHRAGSGWRLDKPVDFVTTEDPWFRPVALTLAPDGCVYIVDWYNKIISHNEVPRTHPDRDKTRGRIWRVKPKAKPLLEVPDFTKLTGDRVIAKLGGESLAQHHLAWQTLADRGTTNLTPTTTLRAIVAGESVDTKTPDPAAPKGVPLEAWWENWRSDAARIGALWALEEIDPKGAILDHSTVLKGVTAKNRNVRREAVRAFGRFAGSFAYTEGGTWNPIYEINRLAKTPDEDPEVRSEVARMYGTTLGELMRRKAGGTLINNNPFEGLLALAKAPLSEPAAPSTHSGKSIKVKEAYDREFERYLVRMFLEPHSNQLAEYLDSPQGKRLSLEARLLASLSLEPKASASRLAALLPQLPRAPEKEEILRLVQFLDEPGVADAVRATLANPATAPAAMNSLLELRTRLDPAKVASIVGDAAVKLLASKDANQLAMGVRLAGAFKLAGAEPALVAVVEKGMTETRDTLEGEPKHREYVSLSPVGLSALVALRDLQSDRAGLFERLLMAGEQSEVRDEALSALAASRAPDAAQRVIALYPKMPAAQHRAVLDKLTTTKTGAGAVVAAVAAGTIAKTDLDAATLDRLLAVLGDKDPALNTLVESLGTLFRDVLVLDGAENACSETGLTLDGPLTVESWVKLAPGITNADGILGAKGQLDLNFHDGRFRVWGGPTVHDAAVAKKKIVSEMWTHMAASRDVAGNWKIYIDGELDATGTKPAGHKIENAQIGWTNAPGGTKGQLAELRIWNRERSATEIRSAFDRGFADGIDGILFNTSGKAAWGKLAPGAKVVKTSDLPPVLAADAAAKLDSDFAKYTGLADKPGDIGRGKLFAAACRACHLMGPEGGQIGPNLSGVGAMGVEAILRNILTPNAAMESAYRIYRVEQKDGSVLDAFYVSEDKDAVVIRLPGAADQRIKKSDIRGTKFLRRSLMPEGLLDAMTPEQVSDLFAYLKSLK